MSTDYSTLLIAEYDHWAIYLHPNQGYLGRCVIWCKRSDALSLTDATIEEQQELFTALRNLEKALHNCFQPNLLNFAFLGNETKHLHGHVIPRYKSPRKFMGIIFTDDLWGKNYRTNHGYVFSKEVLNKVRDLLKNSLRRQHGTSSGKKRT
ncbi:MAG: hypothetical protein Greene07144_678 [Parcubacteria group bacterium Greene0714_4]|nr:MAG: hypothetical protein Greene101415_1088 [Parcubacteria group bacterium Greene1014_15]TSD07844.1 MAG: hypothetical protein Greene07144_678 [Parcubacteria group bacterium Greene0714_4]